MSILPLLEAVSLALLVAFGGVASHVLMHFDVTRDAECLKVGGVEAELLHLLEGVGTLDGLDVVDIHGCDYLALCLAALAERVVAEIVRSYLLPPSLAIQ